MFHIFPGLENNPVSDKLYRMRETAKNSRSDLRFTMADSEMAKLEALAIEQMDECLQAAAEAYRAGPRDWKLAASTLRAAVKLASGLARIEPAPGEVQFPQRGSIPQ
jgi:hypothetical protein